MEYVLSILLVGLAIFLLREVWVSVQVLEIIYRQLMEGWIFTEGPPILGVEQYLLFCLCSAAWFLVVFAFLLSRRYWPLWLVQISFILTPVWVVFFAFFNQRADYELTSLWHFLMHQYLPSRDIFWFILSIVVAAFGGRYCRLMRNKATYPRVQRMG